MKSRKMTVQIKIDDNTINLHKQQQIIRAIPGQHMSITVRNHTAFAGTVLLTYNKAFDLKKIDPNKDVIFDDVRIDEDYTITLRWDNVKRVLNDDGTTDIEEEELTFRVVN